MKKKLLVRTMTWVIYFFSLTALGSIPGFKFASGHCTASATTAMGDFQTQTVHDSQWFNRFSTLQW
jgi:hypothetical protein